MKIRGMIILILKPVKLELRDAPKPYESQSLRQFIVDLQKLEEKAHLAGVPDPHVYGAVQGFRRYQCINIFIDEKKVPKK